MPGSYTAASDPSKRVFYNPAMNAAIAQQLLQLNRKFYADFGAQFSSTRQRIQPGVRKIIATFEKTENILDLGCGNGELARVLAQMGFQGNYTGLDFSLPLLKDAQLQSAEFPTKFLAADLTASDWANLIEPVAIKPVDSNPGQFSVVTAFAVLHHIPGMELREKILKTTHALLAPQGRLIHSNWQFLNSPKLKQRIQPWETIGLSAQDVDPQDYLLDWRAGGSGLRYVHSFSAGELTQLAANTGFREKETFLSDGEGGNLGLYQVWERYENKG